MIFGDRPKIKPRYKNKKRDYDFINPRVLTWNERPPIREQTSSRLSISDPLGAGSDCRLVLQWLTFWNFFVPV